MGIMTEGVRRAAAQSDFVVLESNHDIEMLKTGPYPYPLKRRILSDKGHLSNEACSAELSELVKGGTLRLMLGHLSEQNNTPEIALRTAVAELERAGMKFKSDYTLDVAPGDAAVKSVIF
jgi:phosphoribosyl 1,2-cyclic phosphodiesterase